MMHVSSWKNNNKKEKEDSRWSKWLTNHYQEWDRYRESDVKQRKAHGISFNMNAPEVEGHACAPLFLYFILF